MKTEKQITDQYFTTSDLHLAATLNLWFPLDSIDKSKPRAEFWFKRSSETDAIIQSYWKGDLRIEPKIYANQLKIIKTRLYSHD